MGWMTTLIGDLDLDDPDPKRIRYEVVAHVISGLPRFNRQTLDDWYVGEHAACCGVLAAYDHASRGAQYSDYAVDAVLGALHHDDPESIYGDVIRPLAEYMGPNFKAMTRRVDKAFATAYQMNEASFHNEETKLYDMVMLEAERRVFIKWNDETMKPWAVTEMVKDHDEPLTLAAHLINKVRQHDGDRKLKSLGRLLQMEEIIRKHSRRSSPNALLTKLLLAF